MDFAYINNDKLSGLVKEDAQTLQQGRSDKRLHWVDFAFMAEMETLHLMHMGIGAEHLSSVGYAPDASLLSRLYRNYEQVQSGNVDQYSGLLSSDPFSPLVGTVVSGYVDVGKDDFALPQDEKLEMPDLDFEDDFTEKPIIGEQITELQDNLCGAKYAACLAGLQIKDARCRKRQTGYVPEIDVPDTYGHIMEWSPYSSEFEDGQGYISELSGASGIQSIADPDILNGNIPKGVDQAKFYFSMKLVEHKEAFDAGEGKWDVLIDYSKSVMCVVSVIMDTQSGMYKIDLQDYLDQVNWAMQIVGMHKQNIPLPRDVLWYQQVYPSFYGNIDGIIVFRYDQDHIFSRA